jgi:hypothetical protein
MNWTKSQRAHHIKSETARDKLIEVAKLKNSSDELIAETAADYILCQGPWHGGKWHLAIVQPNRDTPPRFCFYWRRKNLFGITTKNYDEGWRWIVEAMLEGHTVFYSWTKNSPGFSPGSIKFIRSKYQK